MAQPACRATEAGGSKTGACGAPDTAASVLPVDACWAQTSTAPETMIDASLYDGERPGGPHAAAGAAGAAGNAEFHRSLVRSRTGVGVGVPQFGTRRTILAGRVDRCGAREATGRRTGFDDRFAPRPVSQPTGWIWLVLPGFSRPSADNSGSARRDPAIASRRRLRRSVPSGLPGPWFQGRSLIHVSKAIS